MSTYDGRVLVTFVVVVVGSSLGCSAGVSRPEVSVTASNAPESAGEQGEPTPGDVLYIETEVVDAPPFGADDRNTDDITVEGVAAHESPPDATMSQGMGDDSVTASPFAADTPLGDDPESAIGGLMGGIYWYNQRKLKQAEEEV